MPEPPVSPSPARPAADKLQWFQKISQPVLFLIISLALVGGYLLSHEVNEVRYNTVAANAPGSEPVSFAAGEPGRAQARSAQGRRARRRGRAPCSESGDP